MGDVTHILRQIETAGPNGPSELLPLIYEELRRLAACRIQRESAGHTFQATDLVHEAYPRIMNSAGTQPWNSRGHFFAAAAEAMRRILVERARQKGTIKRGGNLRRVELHDLEAELRPPSIDLIALDEALSQLQQKDARKAELVMLRFFAGLTIEESAKILGISTSTADNDWAYAKSWLRVAMSFEA